MTLHSSLVLADLSTIWRYLATEGEFRPSDVIFCLGSAHHGTARRAAALYHLGIASRILVTGAGADVVVPHHTEAEAFSRVLMSSGVPSSAVIVETRATNTGENIEFGLAMLDEMAIDVETITIVAFPTAVRRSVATLARHAPDLDRTWGVPAFEGLGLMRGDPFRAARLALGEIDRLLEYPGLGFIDAVEVPQRILEAAARLQWTLRSVELGSDSSRRSSTEPGGRLVLERT